VGLGFDSHAFGAGGTLVLGGVRFPGVPALAGHSDGDALLHAVIDALLGGASAGDIGEFFPDTSHKWKGASSLKMLNLVLKKTSRDGFHVEHLDVTVVANKPRLTPAKAQLRTRIAKALGLRLASVNLKAKTQEGLSWFPSPGGIAVWAVATLSKGKSKR
jgi:2-C-methyl-D-erythritol 2,4-cyclodiphosphate synthase